MKSFALPTVFSILSACSGVAQPQANEGSEEVACAIGAGSDFGMDCRIERLTVEGARQLVVRHPDGSFRRFTLIADGGGVEVADGADPAIQALDGDTLVVAVAGDRYRFPVRQVAGDAAPE